jgi:hypothetical protein
MSETEFQPLSNGLQSDQNNNPYTQIDNNMSNIFIDMPDVNNANDLNIANNGDEVNAQNLDQIPFPLNKPNYLRFITRVHHMYNKYHFSKRLRTLYNVYFFPLILSIFIKILFLPKGTDLIESGYTWLSLSFYLRNIMSNFRYTRRVTSEKIAYDSSHRLIKFIIQIDKMLFGPLAFYYVIQVDANFTDFQYILFLVIVANVISNILITIYVYARALFLMNKPLSRYENLTYLQILRLNNILEQILHNNTYQLANIIDLGLEGLKWDSQIHADQPSCSICLSEYTQDIDLVKIECNHMFHSHCISQWFAVNHTCPICRHQFNNDVDADMAE